MMRQTPRIFRRSPVRILDAPSIVDNFYLNLLDWSKTNVIAVGLVDKVYLWDATTATVSLLADISSNDRTAMPSNGPKIVTSVSWMQRGSHLAIGSSSGVVQLWDVTKQRCVRTMTGHSDRVGAMAWRDHVLCTSSRDKIVAYRDVRAPEHYQLRFEAHTDEVCGIKWNSTGTSLGSYLATASNDNSVHIYDHRALKSNLAGPGSSGTSRLSVMPLHDLKGHDGGIKAIDWSPHESGVLASGGGTTDKTIRMWDAITTGSCRSVTKTTAQVCNIGWSRTSQELISTHGYNDNSISVWRYPDMKQLVHLRSHRARVLYMAMSPDGQTVATAAPDETLRLWDIFPPSKKNAGRKNRLERYAVGGGSGGVSSSNISSSSTGITNPGSDSESLTLPQLR
ncbi:WD40 repeat-like protein [Ramicandelaber brevisporus]|nr:WD40 repeat-like protein [Ramicandelaber brevisporus]